MLKTVSRSPEIARKIEEYGPGYDEIYLNGIADGRSEGIADNKIEVARNFLADGFDEDIISRCVGISIDELEKLKREL